MRGYRSAALSSSLVGWKHLYSDRLWHRSHGAALQAQATASVRTHVLVPMLTAGLLRHARSPRRLSGARPRGVPQDIYERLDELDPSTFEAEASKLLHGLGFDEKMMAKGTKDMSGQWLRRSWPHRTFVIQHEHLPAAASATQGSVPF